MSVEIIDMPDDQGLQHVVAKICVNYWKRDFPLDTEEWYLNLYAESLSSAGLPIVVVALDVEEFVGTASLISDDELPDATEPGPWLAAVYVNDSRRRQGVGTSLVKAIENRAAELGIAEIYLYTENGMSWYESMGWRVIRTAQLSGHDVTVMTRSLKMIR